MTLAIPSFALSANERRFDLVHTDHLPHAVLIDCTASDDVARLYGSWLERGIHVITPNKRANTGPLEYYRRLRQANRLFSERGKPLDKSALQTIAAEDIRASRVFMQ